MFFFEVLLPSLIIGGLLMYFSQPIADFFKRTGSVNLIRGLDNPWSFKTMGFLIATGYPAYVLMQQTILSSVQ